MKHALSHLFTDFLSALLFVAVYLSTGNIVAGAAAAIGLGLGQAAFQFATGRRIDPMQGVSLGIILVLSAASIAMNSPRFVMLKPTIAHFAIAAAMLKRGWLMRYLPGVAQQNLPEAVPVIAGYAWAGLMLTLGLINLAIAGYADFTTWAWFVAVVLAAVKLGALGLQYVVFRGLVVGRLRRRRGLTETSAVPPAP